MIRVLLVDDQIIIRQGIKSLLQLEPDLQIVGDADNGESALELIATLQGTPQQPSVVLMDVRMPVMDGVAATQQISQRFPNTWVLILTTFDDDEYVFQAMQFGARGYLMKDTSAEEVAVAVRAVHHGSTYLGPGLFQKALSPPPQPETLLPVIPPTSELSHRECQVLQLIAAGASNREIAQTLYISERTVRNHVTSILSRLNLRDRTQAALWAYKNWNSHQ